MSLGQPDVDAYVVARKRKRAASGTIRRELGTLTRMLRLTYQSGKLARLPLFQKPKEGVPRAGFFERHQYDAVRRHLRPGLAAVVAVAYTYGWRVQSEVLTLGGGSWTWRRPHCASIRERPRTMRDGSCI